MRLIKFASVLSIVFVSCKNGNEEINKVTHRAVQLNAINDFKHAIKVNDTLKIQACLPRHTLEENYFESGVAVQIFIHLFEHLDIDRLKDTESISKTIVTQNNHCAERYVISFIGDSITFEDRSEQNPEYKITQQEIADDFDQSSYCEHVVWFNFKVDKGKLKLSSVSGAD
jgi:hypothetical protein